MEDCIVLVSEIKRESRLRSQIVTEIGDESVFQLRSQIQKDITFDSPVTLKLDFTKSRKG